MAEDAHRDSGAELVTIFHGSELASYDFGLDHPLQPSRHQLTIELLEALHWLVDCGVKLESPRPATFPQLLKVHSYAYIQAVEYAQQMTRGAKPQANLAGYGLGTSDNPFFPDILDASTLCVGASIQAMEAILAGTAIHTYNPAGGLHHAMRARASGFCVFNDCAVAIATALESGNRVAYVDIDAHHGDGVQDAFFCDPRVLTISVHESGRFLFPGTGAIDEVGSGKGRGTSINVPLPAFAGDTAYLRAVSEVIEPAVRLFHPDILVTQTGCDSHHEDPLTHLTTTLPVYPRIARALHVLAHDVCGGRWLIVGGGGYDPVNITPRAWTAFFGAVLGCPVEEAELPESWRQRSRALGGDPPRVLLEDPGPTYASLADNSLPALFDAVRTTALAELERYMTSDSQA